MAPVKQRPVSVWWRGKAVRVPFVSRRKRSLRRPAIWLGVSAPTRAAASSIASGMPSRRRQISATPGALRSVSAKPGKTAEARSMNRRTASFSASAEPGRASSSGTPSDGTRQMISGPIRSGSRLVATIVKRGHAWSRPSATRAQLNTRCSQLSSTRSRWEADSDPRSVSRMDSPERSCTPRTAAIACATSSPSSSAASSTSCTPSRNRGWTANATSSARLVLPMPPGPLRVTRRLASTSSATSAISPCRPIKLVRRSGNAEGAFRVSRSVRGVAAAAISRARSRSDNSSVRASIATVSRRGDRRAPRSSSPIASRLRPAASARFS